MYKSQIFKSLFAIFPTRNIYYADKISDSHCVSNVLVFLDYVNNGNSTRQTKASEIVWWLRTE